MTMKRIAILVMAAGLSVTMAFAQPGGREVGENVPGAGRRFIPDPDPEYVVHTQRAATQLVYGGPTNPQGRSYNFTPVFFVYPDSRLDKAGAQALLAEMGIQPVLDANYGTAIVLNPVGEKYDAAKDFDAFVAMFNKSRSGNLKVIGIGAGATFVNQVVAPKAGDHIAGILTVGGQPAKLGKNVDSYGVPAYVSGKKTAAKVTAEYVALNKAVKAGDHYVNPQEELLTVYSDPADRPLADVFAAAWKDVLGRNYRYNNYKHTHYEGQQFGQFGPYELEPYLDCEALGIKRIGFIQLAGKERFFVVEMEWQGSQSYQAMGHDGIETVINQLLAKYPQLDPSRVYAEGLSAGSMTASALGIKKSHVFAAVGGHSGGIMGGFGGAFPGFNPIWNEATQKRGAVEMPYCSVLGTADNVVPFVRPDNWKGNGYLNAWNAYQQMNGMEVTSELDFSADPLFGLRLQDRQTLKTNKGAGIEIETGQLYKGNIPLIKIVAVKDYGHWNFQPTAQIMWDYFKQFRRDPQTKKLVYLGQ